MVSSPIVAILFIAGFLEVGAHIFACCVASLKVGAIKDLECRGADINICLESVNMFDMVSRLMSHCSHLLSD